MTFRQRAGPAGVHLFDRDSGINVLFDEVRPGEIEWDSAPRHVSIAVTNSCDLDCSYCYAPKERASLDPRVLTAWLDELDDNGCLGIGFGGGEPTLYPRLSDVCNHATQQTGLAVTMTTHAHRLDERRLGSLEGNLHFLRVSMDGVGATYERLRGRPFRVLLDRLDQIGRLFAFGINFVVNQSTVADLDDAVAVAQDKGAAEFLLLPQQPVRGVGGIDSRTAERLREWVEAYQGDVPLAVSEGGAEGLPTCQPLKAETGLRAYSHVSAGGLLKASSFDADGVPIGRDGMMAAIDQLRAKLHEAEVLAP